MSDLDALLAALPIDQLAAQLGEDPVAVRQAAGVALPALLGGMQANAQDPGGEASPFSAPPSTRTTWRRPRSTCPRSTPRTEPRSRVTSSETSRTRS
ncbi:MAG: DUF937 domain-containing protein [Nocardioides sp.]